MHKLAVFAEGRTEILFVEKLIEEIAGANNVLIEHRELRGGRNAPRRMKLIKASKPISGEQYFVLLIDCGGDDQVKTRILEEHENLSRSDYSKIIGIRDVRPKFTYAELPKLEAGLRKYIKTALIPVEFILAVMEIEAWFLAEFTHFSRIDPSITLERIQETLGFDPEHDDMSLRLEPVADLNACYSIGGKSYSKSEARNTVAALDYAFVYVELRERIPFLDRLATSVDRFLA